MSNNPRPIEGVDGKYEIGPDGTVLNQENGREVKQTLRSDGRVIVALGGKQHLLHRLVWKAFGNGDKEAQVGHLDGNRQNNHIDNLAPRSEITRNRNSLPDKTVITEEQLNEAAKAATRIKIAVLEARDDFLQYKERTGGGTSEFEVDSKVAKDLLSLELIARNINKITEEL